MLGKVSGRLQRFAERGTRVRLVSMMMLLVLLAVTTRAAQAQKQRRPKIGDRVEVSYMGKLEPGTITGFMPTGWIVVALDEPPMPGMGPMPFPPNMVRFLPEPPKERLWKDSSGAFEIRATLVAKNATSVSLKKADGEVITVPIEKLSSRDRDYVKKQSLRAVSPPPETNQGGPPDIRSMIDEHRQRSQSAVGPGGGAGLSGRVPDTSEYDALPMGDLSGMSTIALSDPKAAWSYTPLPTPAFAPVPVTPVSLPSDGMNRARARKNTLVVSCDGSIAALGMGDPMGRRTHVFVVNFMESRLLASHELPSLEFIPRDVASRGGYVITSSSVRGRPEHVAFWRPTDGSLERVGGWRLPSESPPASLLEVRFVELARAVTIDHLGKLVIWNVRDGTAIAGCEITPQVGRAFNYDGRRMAAFADDAIHLFDLAEGRDLAAISVDGHSPAKLGFSPDGTRLAGLGGGELIVWDLTNGEVLHAIALEDEEKPSSVDWADNRFLIVNHRDLVDIESGMVFWKFSGGTSVQTVAIAPAGNSCYLYEDVMRHDPQVSLCSFLLPLDQISERWEAFRKENLVLLEAGPISIQMQGLPFSRDEQEAIRSSLTKQLQERAFTIQANAPMTLSLRVETGTSEQAEVRDFGENRFTTDPDAVVTYTPTSCEARLTQGETLIWKRYRLNSPTAVFIPKESESSQQAVNRMCQPSASFFSDLRLPRPGLLLPGGKSHIGGCNLTARGLQ